MRCAIICQPGVSGTKLESVKQIPRAARGRARRQLLAALPFLLPNFLGFLVFVFLPVLAAFWFAPMLAAWNGMRAIQALFYSFFATVANWRAFLVYGMVVAAVGTLIPGVAIAFVGAALQRSPAVVTVVPAFVLVFFVALVPTLFASFYASYRDVFPPDAPPQERTPAAPGT